MDPTKEIYTNRYISNHSTTTIFANGQKILAGQSLVFGKREHIRVVKKKPIAKTDEYGLLTTEWVDQVLATAIGHYWNDYSMGIRQYFLANAIIVCDRPH